MKQIAFKLPESEEKYLKWLSERTGTPIGSIYRQATIDTFIKWKVNQLVQEYSAGSISFKQFCDLGNLTLTEGMLIIEQQQIEPPIPEAVDAYTIQLSENNVKIKDSSIYKNGIGIERSKSK